MPEVICRNCPERTIETTKDFDSTRPAHGGMLQLKQMYKDAGWSFCDAQTPTDAIAYDNLTCPACGGWLADSKGFVLIDGESLVCDACGKECKSKLGLGSHMRSHKAQHE